SFVAFFLAVLCWGCNDTEPKEDSAPITLRFNLPEGTIYEYITETRQTISSEVLGTRINIDQNMILESDYTVTGSSEGNKDVMVTNKRIHVKSSNNAVALEYDSADSSRQNEMFKGIGDMVNRPFKFSLSDKGEVQELSTYDNSTATSGAMAQLSEPINDSAIRMMMRLLLDIYPKTPVKTGDAWKTTSSMSIGFMTIQCENTYQLTSVTNNSIAQVDVHSKLTSQTAGDAQAENMTLDM